MKHLFPVIPVLLAACAVCCAQDAPTTRPATAPAAGGDGQIQAKVTLVVKGVYARANADAPWGRVKVGDTFGPGTEFRSGVGAKAVLTISDNSVVLIKSLTQVVLDTLIRREDTVVTKLNLSQGRLRAGVTKGKYQSDFTISSPIASLSVRGTNPIDYAASMDRGDWMALGQWGMLNVQRNVGLFTPGGRGLMVGPGEQTDDKLTPAIVLATFGRMRRATDVCYKLTGPEAGAASLLAQPPVTIPKGFLTWTGDRFRDPSTGGVPPQQQTTEPEPEPQDTPPPVNGTSPGPDGEGETPSDPFTDKDPFKDSQRPG